MDRKPLISIIINNYNYGQFLAEAINSALNQIYPNTEVIVVDDGSKDNSCDIISAYGDYIYPIFKQNGGQASALNSGFEVSRGEILFFLDAAVDRFLNLKLQAFNKEPVFSYLNSIQAKGYYRIHRDSFKLLELAVKVITWHINLTTVIFFAKTVTLAVLIKLKISR